MSGYIQVDERRNRKMESEMIQALQTIADNIQATSQPGVIEYLSICISLVSVLVSGVAIWFAVQVPQKIANRQDKIALYEKRITAFHAMEELKKFSEYISVPDNQNILNWQTEYWGIHNLFESKEVGNLRFSCVERSLLTHKCLEQDVQEINGLCFLFPDVTMGETDIISKELSQFILLIYGESGQKLTDDLVKENRQHFVTVFDGFYNRNKKKMIDLLMLTK